MTSPAEVDAVVKAMRRGEVAIVPTDTVYGLAAAAEDSAAVAAMFALKQRPFDVKIAVLVADAAQARQYISLGEVGEALADAFWPGPLTIVAVRHVAGSLAAGDEETLGVRCPDDAVCRALASALGPIAATSANLHGHPAGRSATEAMDLFPAVSAAVDDGPRPGAASTVVSVAGDSVEVLRAGPISEAAINAAVDRAGH